MTGLELAEPPQDPEPETFGFPIESLRHLADLLGELDEFLRSGVDVTLLLTQFKQRKGHREPDFAACCLIDDLCFTAYGTRLLVEGLTERTAGRGETKNSSPPP
jgi:hypothetical protein